MGGGHVSRPDFGMAQPDPAHPLTEFYLLVQQALDKAGCFALPALYASLQAPARRIYPEEAREYLRLAPQAGEGFVRLQAAAGGQPGGQVLADPPQGRDLSGRAGGAAAAGLSPLTGRKKNEAARELPQARRLPLLFCRGSWYTKTDTPLRRGEKSFVARL